MAWYWIFFIVVGYLITCALAYIYICYMDGVDREIQNCLISLVWPLAWFILLFFAIYYGIILAVSDVIDFFGGHAGKIIEGDDDGD